MDSDRRTPSWLKATIRAALIAAAVGGGFFVLSQVLAPSEAHAETVPDSASAVGHAASDDSLLGPTLTGVGSTLGTVTHAADGVAGGVGSTVNAVTKPTTGAASSVISTAIHALPAPVQAPVKAASAPVAQTVTHVTSPVTQSVSQLGAAKPASGIVGGVSSTVDGAVSGVEQAPGIGAAVSGIAGHDPISAVTTPAAAGLDDTAISLAGTVDTTVTQATDGLAAGLSGDAPTLGSLPIVSGLLPGGDGLGFGPASALASGPAALPTAVSGPASERPFGPVLTAIATVSHGGLAPTGAASTGGVLPLGSPLAPAGLLGGGTGSAAAGNGGGNGSSPFSGSLSGLDFPALGAGLSTLEGTDALPASPVFENDSTPD